MGGMQLEQPLYMGGKIRAAYKMSLLGKEMAQMNETLTATEVILKTDQAYALVVKAKGDENSGRHIPCRIGRIAKERGECLQARTETSERCAESASES